MPTSLSDLLDALSDHPRDLTTRPDHADADFALGHLGTTLQRLADDGLGDDIPERAHWAREAARACRDLAATRPDSGGRLSQLAAAIADTTALLRREARARERWAIAIAVSDTVHHLTQLAFQTDVAPERRRALLMIEASTMIISRLAALDPPSAQDAILLDRAVRSGHLPVGVPAALVLHEAIAQLISHTHPGRGELAIAEVLAISIALESLCRSVDQLRTDPFSRPAAGLAARAGAAWQHVRRELRPFNDGSRIQHSDTPPVVSCALTIHHTLHRHLAAQRVANSNTAYPRSHQIAGAVRDALHQLATVTVHLELALASWARTGHALAYARDLALDADRPMERIAAVLAGHRTSGLVHADSVDLLPVRRALTSAQQLSTELATQLDRDRDLTARMPSTVPHLADAHAQSIETATEPLTAARAYAAYRSAQAPAGGRRPGPAR